MSELVLKHVYKTYENDVQVIKDFNLEVPDKEFVVFVGPSGCGKSTILRMIAGLEEITDGTITIDGEKISKKMASEGKLAMVFQNYALYPHMTVAENIAYSLKIKGVKKKIRNKRVSEVADILGLSEVLDRKPKQLSGGQKQRVAMGRAIIRKPELFLMDEPLSNLDAKFRNQMRSEIARLYERLDSTFVYVTHDQTEAMTLGTRIVVLKDGIIQQSATPRELYDTPENMFVAGFIGSPQMNFLRGKIIKEQHRTLLRVVGIGDLVLPESKALSIPDVIYYGREVVVGIRPEDVHVTHISEVADESKLFQEADGNVEVYELLGADALVHMKTAGGLITARMDTDRDVNCGDKVKFTFDMYKIHMFDEETEQVIKKTA